MKYLQLIGCCLLVCVFLLNGCTEQPSEGTQPSGDVSVTTTQTETPPDTQPTEGEETETRPPVLLAPVPTPSENTNPTEGADTPDVTEPTEQQPSEPTQEPGLDEDELPPMPIG